MPLSTLSSDDLRQLVEATSVATWAVEGDGTVIHGKQWEDLTGQPLNPRDPDDWLATVHADDRKRVSAAWHTSLTHGQPLNTDFRVRCADGVYRWINSRSIPLLDSDGIILMWVGLCLEIPGTWRFNSSAMRTDADTSATATLSPASVRAARALLNWSANDLAANSGVSTSTIRRFEREEAGQSRPDNISRLRQAFEKHGVKFIVHDNVCTGAALA